MANIIVKYQKAVNTICDKLRETKKVRAVMIFGSMVTGDLWEESDIDLIMILDDVLKDNTNIFTEENDVPVHIKIISKEYFLKLSNKSNYEKNLYKNILAARLLISKDKDIEEKFNKMRYLTVKDESKLSLVYLSALLKDIRVCRKFLLYDSKFTAFKVIVRCINNFSKFIVNNEGYMINKDATTVSLELNDEWKKIVYDIFFGCGEKKEDMQNAIDYMNLYIKRNIKGSSRLLLDVMRQKNEYLSSTDLQNLEIFKEYKISMEELLKKLYEFKIIKRKERILKDSQGANLIKEHVYFYEGI